jgi:hypothetical protein
MPRLRLSLLALLTGLLLAPSAASADCPGADVQPTAGNVVEVRAAVICLTNAERAAAGLGGLAPESRLEAVAQGYAQRMVDERFFAHVGPDGATLAVRLLGYLGSLAFGENLAWGEGSLATPASTVAAWMRSPGHRANILLGVYSEVGVGVALGTPGGSSRPAATFVADYGARGPLQPVAASTIPPAPAPAPAAAPHRPAKARPAPRRCRRGTVRRVQRVKGRRVVRCVRMARRR